MYAGGLPWTREAPNGMIFLISGSGLLFLQEAITIKTNRGTNHFLMLIR